MKKLSLYILALVLLVTPAMAGSSWSDIFNNSATAVINLVTQVTGTLAVANGGTGCTGVRVVSSGTSDTVLSTDCTVAWNSASSGVKAESLAACSSSNSGRLIIFKDEYGNAGGVGQSISLTPASGTIEGYAVAYISVNLGAYGIECDGVSNWIRVF